MSERTRLVGGSAILIHLRALRRREVAGDARPPSTGLPITPSGTPSSPPHLHHLHSTLHQYMPRGEPQTPHHLAPPPRADIHQKPPPLSHPPYPPDSPQLDIITLWKF
ncbi:hypothetical protein E2C01_032881 [Portunus trituberculatus]|uniref:Uncharacterized protein n=1 Tax=Portunus trituberculatus TaxID=210409 RepID=A0A5B7F1I8_PORTR|nr:hypothetical protein [Portunus trituberculatus]